MFRAFVLLASSDSDKRMLMRQKVQTKIRLDSPRFAGKDLKAGFLCETGTGAIGINSRPFASEIVS